MGVAKQGVREFEGVYREQMLLIRQLNLVPARMADIMRFRLNGELSWHSFYISAGGIAYAGESRDAVKIIPYSQVLTEINPEKEYPYYGQVNLSPRQYRKIEAREFTGAEVPFNVPLTEKQASEHEGWLEAVEGDRALLREYASEVSRRDHQCMLPKIEIMCFYIGDPRETPALLPLGIGGMFNNSRISYIPINDYRHFTLVGLSSDDTRKTL